MTWIVYNLLLITLCQMYYDKSCCRFTRTQIRLSSVVCNVRTPYSGSWNFRQYFFAILDLSHPLTSVQNFTEIVPWGNPSAGSVKREMGSYLCHVRVSHLLMSFLSESVNKLHLRKRWQSPLSRWSSNVQSTQQIAFVFVIRDLHESGRPAG